MEDQSGSPEHVPDEGRGGPVEESTASIAVPRADGEGEEVLRQQPIGHGQVLGGGEFPSPNQPPGGPEEAKEG